MSNATNPPTTEQQEQEVANDEWQVSFDIKLRPEYRATTPQSGDRR